MMDPKDIEEFDASHLAYLKLRDQGPVRHGFDLAVEKLAPVLREGISAGADVAADLVPGGPLAKIGIEVGAKLLKDAFDRWIAAKTPAA